MPICVSICACVSTSAGWLERVRRHRCMLFSRRRQRATLSMGQVRRPRSRGGGERECVYVCVCVCVCEGVQGSTDARPCLFRPVRAYHKHTHTHTHPLSLTLFLWAACAAAGCLTTAIGKCCVFFFRTCDGFMRSIALMGSASTASPRWCVRTGSERERQRQTGRETVHDHVHDEGPGV
jgi:hypothetical protein